MNLTNEKGELTPTAYVLMAAAGLFLVGLLIPGGTGAQTKAGRECTWIVLVGLGIGAYLMYRVCTTDGATASMAEGYGFNAVSIAIAAVCIAVIWWMASAAMTSLQTNTQRLFTGG